MNRISENTTQVQELIEEVILTFRRLRAASSEIHGHGSPIPGQRGVLIDLARGGPQTVPGMARARGVSRQHIQVLIDRFRSRGLIELVDNPAHLRSKLVRLTRTGRTLVNFMSKREDAALRSLDLTLPAPRIRKAILVLRALRQSLESNAWAGRNEKRRLLQRKGTK